jgi:alpha-N-arabinofuranosidase
MFATYHGDEVIRLTAKNVPVKEWQPFDAAGIGPLPKQGNEVDNAGRVIHAPVFDPGPPATMRQPAPQQVPLMFFDATLDSKTGRLFIKVVNRSSVSQDVHVVVSGVSAVASIGQSITLRGRGPNDTNTITAPTNIVPMVARIPGLGTNFATVFPPYSVNVLELQATK